MANKPTVMMLTWEFPPRIIGGISPHVLHLSKSLVKTGAEVYVVTCDFPGAPKQENIEGVQVFRIDSYKNPAPDFATWIYLMNINMQKEAASLVNKLEQKVDIFHAHDWLVATAGIGLKHVFRKPLIATIHSTEIGRRDGIHSDYEKMIHETEAWLAYEAWKVICCSQYMVSHVQWAFRLPEDKLSMIPNGVNSEEYNRRKFRLHTFRKKFAMPEEKLALFVGRLVYEKGVHVFVNAIPKILEKVNTKFVIVGNGYMKESLLDLVNKMGLAHKVHFTGFVDDDTLRNLQKCADVSVVPSLFEPFGIVALEAMAARSPIVVSDTGGLSEIVEHEVTGIKIYPNDSDSLAWGVNRILLDGKLSDKIRKNAHNRMHERYNWDKISQETKSVYENVLDEYRKSHWD